MAACSNVGMSNESAYVQSVIGQYTKVRKEGRACCQEASKLINECIQYNAFLGYRKMEETSNKYANFEALEGRVSACEGEIQSLVDQIVLIEDIFVGREESPKKTMENLLKVKSSLSEEIAPLRKQYAEAAVITEKIIDKMTNIQQQMTISHTPQDQKRWEKTIKESKAEVIATCRGNSFAYLLVPTLRNPLFDAQKALTELDKLAEAIKKPQSPASSAQPSPQDFGILSPSSTSINS